MKVMVWAETLTAAPAMITANNLASFMMVNTFWIFLVTYKLLFSAIQKELQTIIQDLTHPFFGGGWLAGLKSGTRFIMKPSNPQDQIRNIWPKP